MPDEQAPSSSAGPLHGSREQGGAWSGRKLGSLCELVNGFAFEPSDWDKEGVPIIRIQNLNGSSDFNFFRGKVPNRYRISPGDLLFSWSGNRGTSFGPFNWRGPTGYLNQHIFKVLPRADVNQRWLYHALHEVRQRAEKNAHGGSGLVHVKASDLVAYDMLIPVEDEQRAIADVLDAVDAALHETESLIAKLKVLRVGLIDHLLSCGSDKDKDHFELVSNIQHDSEATNLPAFWRIYSMKELTTVIVDGVHQTPHYIESGVPFVTVENLVRGSCISLDPCRYITPYAHNQYIKRAHPRFADVLVSKDGTLGIARIVTEGLPEFSIFVSVALLRPRQDRVRPEFLRLFFETGHFRKQLRSLSAGSGLQHIHLEHFNRFRLAVPSLGEQDRILSVLKELGNRLEEQSAAREKLEGIRQALRHDLLTGRVRVPVAAEAAA